MDAAHSDPRRTVGVEEELLLVDAEDAQPRAVAAMILAGHDEPSGVEGAVGHELQLQQVEIGTPPTVSMTELRDQITAWRRRADELAAHEGARVAALATCPLPVVPRTTVKPRYLAMIEHLGVTTAEQLTCGCHVHVSVESADEGAAVLDRIRGWLPVLVALSANSPFWQGADSGYASFRTQAWHRFPTAGPTPLLGSGAAYRAHVAALLATGVPLDEGMIYFDARLSRTYPTVELRVADVCLRAQDTVLVAALARALVDTAAVDWQAGRPAPDVSSDLIRMATWQASRHGLNGELLDVSTGAPRLAKEVVTALVEHVADALSANGDTDLVADRIEALAREGTGADVQRREAQAQSDLTGMVLAMAELTVSGS